jgi:RNA polymerase subunit RPABC4/transcription elongation factor Spt4
MNTKTEAQTVTIAGATYTVENWSGMTMLISNKGTAYCAEEGISQPHSFPGGTPLRKKGNPVRVMNVGGIIEEHKK